MQTHVEDYPIFQKVDEWTYEFPVMSETVDQIVEASIFRFLNQ